MSYLKINLAAILLIMVSACSHNQLNSTQYTANEHKEQSVILTNYELTNGMIQFSTLGFGCTFYNNYQIIADKSDNSLEVIEVVADKCQMKPRSVELSYSIQHLDLNFETPIIVKNPIVQTAINNLAAL